jgi:membrane protein required for colicin V production
MIDLWLGGMIAGYVFGGFRTGFVRRLASLGFLALSFVAASYLHMVVAGVLVSVLKVREDNAGLFAFIVTFVVVYVALNLIARPFLARIGVSGMSRVTNQVLGAALGLAEGVLLASVAIVIITTYGGDSLVGAATQLGIVPDLAKALEGSAIARFLMDTTVPLVLTVLGPLLPPDIKSVVDLLPSD